MSRDGIISIYSSGSNHIRCSKFYRLNELFTDRPGLTLKYVISGQESYSLEKERIVLRSGQAVFFHNEQSFECRIHSNRATKGICIDLDTNGIADGIVDPLMEKEVFLLDPELKTQQINVLDRNLEEILRNVPVEDSVENPLYFQELFNEISMHVHSMETKHILELECVPLKKINARKEIYKRLIVAKNYIADHYVEGVSLKEISSECQISVFYLQRLFKRVFGCSPSGFLEELRMEKAMDLLNPSTPISEVAYMIGYNDVSYFSRRFKKKIGVSPKQYASKNI